MLCLNKITFKNLSIAIILLANHSYVFASVEQMKLSGSLSGYELVEDRFTPSVTNPAFVTNELGSDDYKPRIKLDAASGKPTAIDISNASGAPSINLGNSWGSNNSINNAINNASQSGGNEYGRWIHEHTVALRYDGNNNRWHHPDYPLSLAGRPWSDSIKYRSCIKGLKGTARQNIVGTTIYFHLYHCR